MLFSKVLRLLALGCWLLLPVGCAPTPPQALPAAPLEGDGLVWRVTGGKVPFFLAGSFHVLRPGDLPLPESYEVAWRETRHLVLEILPGEAARPEVKAAVAQLITLPEGRRVQDLLPPATSTRLAQFARSAALPEASLERLKPWMAGIQVAMAAVAPLGFRQELGVEPQFQNRPADPSRSVEALETVLGQLRVLDAIPAAVQLRMLDLALDQASRTPGEFPALVKAWRQGDANAVHRLLSVSFQEFPEIGRQLIQDRNAAWLPRLESLLQGGRPTMVLVGAGHLCGPGSLVELLTQKGYQCVPVKSAPPASAPVKKAA
jgi:uncharacterized protein YbaP (TraB family)